MGKAYLIGNGPKCLVPAESRNELRGKEQKSYVKNSVNKAHAKDKNANAAKVQKGLTRFSSDQPFNQPQTNHSKNEVANKSKSSSNRNKPKGKR
jgi:hypothetical protein